MATPPRRGRGLACKCLSCEGAATQPRRDAKSLTYRVRTKEHSSDRKKIARKLAVNLPPGHYNHKRRSAQLRPARQYCSSLTLAGSELTGSSVRQLRVEGCSQSSSPDSQIQLFSREHSVEKSFCSGPYVLLFGLSK